MKFKDIQQRMKNFGTLHDHYSCEKFGSTNGLQRCANLDVSGAVNERELVQLAIYMDAQGSFAEADALDAALLRMAKSFDGVKAKAEAISREFLGMYTIHSIAGSNPNAAVVVYADNLNAIPASAKKKMRAMAKPYDVRFKRSEDQDADFNRLDELI